MGDGTPARVEELAVLGARDSWQQPLNMKPTSSSQFGKGKEISGFTLAEAVIALAILALLVQGIILCYVRFTQQAEWSAYSLAAQSLASQGAEQARSAKWDPQAWPQGIGPGQPDELGLTQYAVPNTLKVPPNGQPIIVTNYVKITSVSTNPPLRQIRSDCAWNFLDRGAFTNTVILLRAADQ